MSCACSLTSSAGILYNALAMPTRDEEQPANDGARREDADRALITAFKGGDESAFVALVAKYRDRIYRLAFATVQDANEADDIAQEVFLKVYFKIQSFRETSAFFTWLYSIAVNECRHGLRKRKRRVVSLDAPLAEDEPTTLGDLLPSGEKDIESQLVSAEDARRAQALIDGLPDKYRDIYVLRMVDGLSYEDLSRTLGISIPLVKIWLFRARKKIDDMARAWEGAHT